MIIKSKAYYLKKDIDIDRLLQFDFLTQNDEMYYRDIDDRYSIRVYKENRIIKKKATNFVWSVRVKKHIWDLILADYVEIRPYYYWVGLNCRNYSEKKNLKIEAKIKKLEEKQ